MDDSSDCDSVYGYSIIVRVWSDQDHGFPHIFTSEADARQAGHDKVQKLIEPMVPEENAKIDAWAAGITCGGDCERVVEKVGPTPISYTYRDVNADIVQCTGRFDIDVTITCQPKKAVIARDAGERAALAQAAARDHDAALPSAGGGKESSAAVTSGTSTVRSMWSSRGAVTRASHVSRKLSF